MQTEAVKLMVSTEVRTALERAAKADERKAANFARVVVIEKLRELGYLPKPKQQNA